VSTAALERGQVVAAMPGSLDAREYVSCGKAGLDMQVSIVDPETRASRPDGAVGEVWVRGPSVAAGYWDRKEESELTFCARLRDGDDGPFLRTGDLGFLENGELFISGRLKDVLVIRGRNHNPEEIERTVQAAHPGLRANCGAAFESGQDGESRLIVVQEVQRGNRHLDFDRLLGDVRLAVADRHGLHVHDLQLLEFGSIPKTSSGKIQRHRCRLGYEQGTLKRWKKAKECT
jgi:acyl-CoA synthetase (AMP-forming)/AMP-acid ligase II